MNLKTLDGLPPSRLKTLFDNSEAIKDRQVFCQVAHLLPEGMLLGPVVA
ncbi:hypothetical protein [Methylobacterium sp. CM6247]